MTMRWETHYQMPDKTLWQGRDDGLKERYHQLVQFLPLNKPFNSQKNAFAFLGFASDEGVKRNQGRPGAIEGPTALRKALSNLPFHCASNITCFDVGNITCSDNDLETAQSYLGDCVALLHEKKFKTILFGGGHEIAWGHYQGLAKHYSNHKIGIINFDAHFDLRPFLSNQQGSSGTPFRQIANHCQQHHQAFHYLCLGIQRTANTPSLYQTAHELGVVTIEADIIYQNKIKEIIDTIDSFVSQVDCIYLTLCLDVFANYLAPGVSCQQAFGLQAWQVVSLLRHLLKTKKIISFDIAELAPCFDIDDRTAKLAAGFVTEYIHGYQNI